MIKLLNLNLKSNLQELTYENIVIASDADCFHESTKVYTNRGLIALKDIKYGDLVLTHNNEWKPVIEIIEKLKTECIKVEINGDILYMSKNHKLPVIRDNQLIIITAKDLKLTDLLLQNK